MGSEAQHAVMPLSALVGHAELTRALLALAVDPSMGGVLIRGEKGTAKSTAARALARVLPPADGGGAPPFETLPLGVTEDQLIGTLDLEHALRTGEQRFASGLLARVHRGVLYVDEVNLLDDHIVDLLLDVAVSGVNVVAREGFQISHPAAFVLIGTMNPEEGELRPQLLDRFGLCADVRGLDDPEQRAEIVARRLAFDRDPAAFRAQWAEREAELTRDIAAARERVRRIRPERDHCVAAARIALAFGVDGHRADILLVKCGAALAALAGREQLTADDLATAATVVLPHRLRRKPFDSERVAPDELHGRAREIAEGEKKNAAVRRG